MKTLHLKSQFEFEFEMAKPVWNYFNKQSTDKQAFFPVSEFVTPWGIADLVMLKFDISKINSRIDDKLTTPIITKLSAMVMNTLKYDKKTSIEELSFLCSKESNFLKRNILSVLLNENYILEPSKNFYKKNKNYSPIASDIIAIELKKTNWKSAISQAQRYRLFADRVYVALPEAKVNKLSSDLSKFINANVGLLSVNGVDAVKTIQSKKIKPLSPTFRTICEERAFVTLLNVRKKSLLSAIYKIKPSLQMETTRLSFRLKESLVI